MTLEPTTSSTFATTYSSTTMSGTKPNPAPTTPRRQRKDKDDHHQMSAVSGNSQHICDHHHHHHHHHHSHNRVHTHALHTPPSLFRSNNCGDDGDDEQDEKDDEIDDDDDENDVHMNTALDAIARPNGMVNNSTELPAVPSGASLRYPQRVKRIASAVRTILDCLDDEPRRIGLFKTPERYAKALLSLTEGYSQSLEEVVKDAKFSEMPSETVMVRNIDVFSMCEHHLLPFHGVCHVAYLPNSYVIGLSKVARIVNMYARRLQVQERLTAQIADAVAQSTNAHGVMVLISCTHMCMSMRGVEKVGARTNTTVTRGRYATDHELRSEFLATLSCTQNQ